MCVCVCVCAIDSYWTRQLFIVHAAIGACRAVWVPGQDLATPHLMCNCGKRILSLHCTLYICLWTHMLYTDDHVSLRPVLVIWVRMLRNNLGNARVCPGLQAPMHAASEMDGNNARKLYKSNNTAIGNILITSSGLCKKVSIESQRKLFNDYCLQQFGKRRTSL